jgi:hypothetical protein
MRLGMKAPISRSRRVKLRSVSTCNAADSSHQADPLQQSTTSNSEAKLGCIDHTLAISGDQVLDLTSLVWKFFGDEIHDALIETQQSLGAVDNDTIED